MSIFSQTQIIFDVLVIDSDSSVCILTQYIRKKVFGVKKPLIFLYKSGKLHLMGIRFPEIFTPQKQASRGMDGEKLSIGARSL